MQTVGMQYIIDIFNVNTSILEDNDYLYDHFSKSLSAGDMNIVGEGKRHTFPNGGSTFIFILQESHASLHSYPEHNFLAIDIFVCAGKNPFVSIEYFINGLNKGIRVNKKTIDRGNSTDYGEKICV